MKTLLAFIPLIVLLNGCREEKTIAPTLEIEPLINHAEWVADGNAESGTWLERYSPVLYHHGNVMKTGSIDSQKWLQLNSPVMYHHADWIVNKNESSGEWLKENDLPLYHHANCLITKSEESKYWLRREGWKALYAHADWFMTGKKVERGWKWRWQVGMVPFI